MKVWSDGCCDPANGVTLRQLLQWDCTRFKHPIGSARGCTPIPRGPLIRKSFGAETHGRSDLSARQSVVHGTPVNSKCVVCGIEMTSTRSTPRVTCSITCLATIRSAPHLNTLTPDEHAMYVDLCNMVAGNT